MEVMSPLSKLRHFHQTLTGLRTIHAQSMIHGRTSPSRLAMVHSIGPERDANIGNDMGIRHRAAFYHLEGMQEGASRYDQPSIETIWTAPEVWRSSPLEPYIYKADIYSLAIVWLHVLIPGGVGVGFKINATRYANLRRMMKMLRTTVSSELLELPVAMTKLNPDARPTVDEALAHAAWQPLADSANTDERCGPSSSRTAKRLRLSDPPLSSSVLQRHAQASSPHSVANAASSSPPSVINRTVPSSPPVVNAPISLSSPIVRGDALPLSSAIHAAESSSSHVN